MKLINRKKIGMPELLAPAGNMASVFAAVANGCDAVYLGGRNFSARSFADNFDDSEIKEVIEFCHLRGVRVYVAVNTVYTNDELDMVFGFMNRMYMYGADAFILQDIGVAERAMTLFPDIEFHASTQMTAQSLEDVLYLQKLGFSRVILSRELSINEIKYIKDNCDVELEVFVHGALCVCYSGQCLMSSFIGKRSGNRGRCAQPCRQVYDLYEGDNKVDSGYLLCTKDLMSIEILEDIIATGVTSLKIEGRMKNEEYVATVVKSYCDKLGYLANTGNYDEQKAISNLKQVFNRGGFTEGYFTNYAGTLMMSKESPKSIGTYLGKVLSYDRHQELCKIFTEADLVPGDGIEIWTKTKPNVGTGISKESKAGDIVFVNIKGEIGAGDAVYKSYDKKLMDEAKSTFVKDTRKVEVSASVKAIVGQPLYLRLSYDILGITVEKNGEIVEAAQKAPMTKEKICEQLAKTGGTPFEVVWDSAEVSDNVFLPVSKLNDLRRQCIDELTEKINEQFVREGKTLDELLPELKARATEKKLTVRVRTKEQLDGVLDALGDGAEVGRVYIDLSDKSLDYSRVSEFTSVFHDYQCEVFVVLSMCFHREHKQKIIELLETDVDGFLAESLGSLYVLEEYDKNRTKKIAAGYRFNTANYLSYDFLMSKMDSVTFSPEVGFDKVEEIGCSKGEMVIHGKLPVMTVRQCPIGLFADGKANGRFCKMRNNHGDYFLRDKMNVKFPVITDCNNCIAYIYSDRPIFMLNKMRDVIKAQIGFMRINLSDENMEESKNLVKAYYEMYKGGRNEAAIAVSEKIEKSGFTYGYFYSDFDE